MQNDNSRQRIRAGVKFKLLRLGVNVVTYSTDGSDTLVVLFRAKRSKIEAFRDSVRENQGMGQMIYAVEKVSNVLCLRLDTLDTLNNMNQEDEDRNFYGIIKLDERSIENLKKVATSSKAVNAAMVSDDLEVTYSILVLTSPIMKISLQKALEIALG